MVLCGGHHGHHRAPTCCLSRARVVLCRLLQKNKRFYYQTRHFVSVASMTYRMKRNGAGLASICILATMVLVTHFLHHLPVLWLGKPAARPLSARCKYRSAGGCA